MCDEESADRCPDADDVQRQALREVNRLRDTTTRCGAINYPPASQLDWSDVFFRAADDHALDMAGNNFVAAIGSDGLGVSDWVDAEVTFVCQLVSGGSSSVDGVIGEWLANASTCATLKDPRAQSFALACRYDDDSDFGTYWVLVAGDR